MAKKAHRPESHLARSLGSKEIQWDGVYTPYISDGVTDVAVSDMVVKQDLDQLAVKSVNGKAGDVVVDLPDFPVVDSAIAAEREARASADASLQQQVNDKASIGYVDTGLEAKADNSALAAKQNQVTYGTTDLTDGTSALATGDLYLVYE